MIKKILLGFLCILCVGMMMIIISLHVNNRTGYLCLNKLNIPTNLKYISNNTIILSNKSTQYIWCVNHYGPNNQLKDFFKCCIIAMINNYTLIIPPLFPHYGDEIRGIQWFDHFYDLKQLSRIINIQTLDQFISEKLNTKRKLMINCYIKQIELVAARTWYPLNTIISIQNFYKINIDFNRYINLSRQFNLNDLSNQAKNCSSIFLHIHYTTFNQFFLSPNIHTRSIFENLHRNKLIQRMTSELIKFLPKLVPNKNNSRTHSTILAVIHMRLGDHTVMSVPMYIKQILYLIKTGVHFTHLHIMCPYLNSTDIKQLTDSLPIAFTTTQHLISHVRYLLDGYLFDVLEQEIAYQAPFFLASPWTTYSATVLMQKVYQEKGTVYVLSAKSNAHPFLVTKKNVRYF